jgi:hypothetical protein
MSAFNKAIIQSILLYGSESWVLSKFMLEKLYSFHNMCARYITGRDIKLANEQWEYPCSATTLKQSNLLNIKEYIIKRRTTVKKYVDTTQIIRDCQNLQAVANSARKLAWWDFVGDNETGTNISANSGSDLTPDLVGDRG